MLLQKTTPYYRFPIITSKGGSLPLCKQKEIAHLEQHMKARGLLNLAPTPFIYMREPTYVRMCACEPACP